MKTPSIYYQENCLFGYDFKRNIHQHFLVKFYGGRIRSNLLNQVVLDGNVLALHIKSFFDKSFSNLDGIHRAEDLALGTGLGTNGQTHFLKFFCLLESSLLLLCLFVSTLAEDLLVDLPVLRCGINGISLGDQVVSGITILDDDNVILMSQIGHVLF